MAFASIHIPGFILQAILRARPELRNHPLAVIDGTPPRQTVIAANHVALQSGLQLGMTKSQAEEFPAVLVVQRSPAQETAAHAALLDLGWSVSPRIEDTAPDTILLDLDGLASLFGTEDNIAHRLARGATELGLTSQIAVASNIETAFHTSRGYAACRQRRDMQEITVVPRGEEATRMSSLPVRILSLSEEMAEILGNWGVRTCGDLAALPLPQLSERLGQAGVRLREWARGAGSRSLVLAEPQTGFTEEMELDDAVAELDPLSFVLGRLLDQLCARLAARCLSAASIHLHFDLESARQSSVDSPYRGENPVATFQKTLALPVPIRNSKLLLKLARLQLQANPPAAAVVKVIVSAEAARPRATQNGLFVPAYPEPEKLELTIARLANLVGESNIGAPELVDTHRPGAFRLDKFLSVQRAPQAEDDFSLAPKAVLRVFRPPLAMNVELGDDRPRRVFFHGRCGDVAVASGPWRTSGEWWASPSGLGAGSWQWDEWDVEVHFHSSPAENQGIARGIYRIYFDRLCQSWFVYGVYD